MSGTSVNSFLMEYTPSNRVQSGEIIVFQNEMIEIFKEMVSKSNEGSIRTLYVTSVIVEFFHALIENQIP